MVDYLGSFTDGALKGYGFVHGIQQDKQNQARRDRLDAREERRLGVQEENAALNRRRLEWDQMNKEMEVAGQKITALMTNPQTGDLYKDNEVTQGMADRLTRIINQHKVGHGFLTVNPGVDKENPVAGIRLYDDPTTGKRMVGVDLNMTEGGTQPLTMNRSADKNDPVAAMTVGEFGTYLRSELNPKGEIARHAERRKSRAATSAKADERQHDVSMEGLKHKHAMELEGEKASNKGITDRFSKHNPQTEGKQITSEVYSLMGGKFDSEMDRWVAPEGREELVGWAASAAGQVAYAEPDTYAPQALAKAATDAAKHLKTADSAEMQATQEAADKATFFGSDESDFGGSRVDWIAKRTQEIQAEGEQAAAAAFQASVRKLPRGNGRRAAAPSGGIKGPGSKATGQIQRPNTVAGQQLSQEQQDLLGNWVDPRYQVVRWNTKDGRVITMNTILKTALKYNKTPYDVMRDNGLDPDDLINRVQGQ